MGSGIYLSGCKVTGKYFEPTFGKERRLTTYTEIEFDLGDDCGVQTYSQSLSLTVDGIKQAAINIQGFKSDGKGPQERR